MIILISFFSLVAIALLVMFFYSDTFQDSLNCTFTDTKLRPDGKPIDMDHKLVGSKGSMCWRTSSPRFWFRLAFTKYTMQPAMCGTGRNTFSERIPAGINVRERSDFTMMVNITKDGHWSSIYKTTGIWTPIQSTPVTGRHEQIPRGSLPGGFFCYSSSCSRS